MGTHPDDEGTYSIRPRYPRTYHGRRSVKSSSGRQCGILLGKGGGGGAGGGNTLMRRELTAVGPGTHVHHTMSLDQ